MALLTKEQRQARFKYLGLGEYNAGNIKKFQKKYLRAKDVDGIYGVDTDNALRHVYNVKKYTKNFEPEEFKCECGGRYCTGYPSYMKKVELENLQSIRAHWNKPMTVTCGLRCKTYNSKLNGSIANSKHLTGYATDFYMKGVTDTLANRKASIKWIKKLPNHNYTYGDGINSYGFRLSASYMGNALHTDTNKAVTTTASAKIIANMLTSTAAAATTTAKTKPQKAVDYAKKLAKDDSWHYVVWNGNDKKTQLCPICHKYPKGKHHGFNCIRFVFACWRHGGGINCKCDGGLIHNSLGNKMLKAKTDKAALKMAQKAIGCKNIKIIRNKNGIPQSKLKPGDACLNFSGNTYKHLFLYAGNGKMVDCGRWSNQKKQIAVRKAVSCKIAIRYVEPTKQTTTKTTSTTTTAAKDKKVTQYLTQAELDKWFAALKKQYKNAKNSKYAWVEGPTYANSDTKSTCIAEHSVALQLLGLLPKGGYFYYHPTKKQIWGNRRSYVKKHTELFKLSYPHKKLTTLIKEGKLQPGDIVGFGNPGYHSMVYMGKNSKGQPIFTTLGHKKGYKVTYPYYAKRKVDMIVRLKKVSK